ncbi:efflux RND transporter periplasmic adaptor subunit [Bradyrhizobium sp. ORS 111]|uniref:efflux RND transporter periplasmic adaptor subunit n=1 Tax=Bradyrhizobium sp. ORS 111 TaxID=1685958 RepID=UPI00388D5EA6
MIVTVSAEGKTRVKEPYELVAPIAGKLLRIALKAGDRVVANQTVIFTIEPPQPQLHDSRSNAELEAKVHAAEAAQDLATADLARAKADNEFAQRENERNRELSRIGAVADKSLQQTERDAKMREAAVQVAENVVKQRMSEVELARASLSGPGAVEGPTMVPNLEVRSPINGRVLNVLKESEVIVSPGMPIVQLGDTANLEVMLEMLSEDAVKVEEGASATLEGWGGKRLSARVRRVEPAGFTKISALGIEEQRVRVLLDFLDPPEQLQHLGTGYRISAKIVVWTAESVLKVPLGGLFRDGNRWACYVVKSGLANLVHVEVGHLNEAEAEVLDGVKEGETVILHPSDRITAGVPVKLRS